ncbi:hypothetical protein M8C13_38505 [Crossiella sp. SN42]|uniref:hypothetical protein n=1 Tax=Crossiella sp. SN42 TaxID=2944808 RepID=UPI00207C84BA|nr:hypothetical protein [Crossiella sp. SN42]MCO1581657.1 hypothetical protein [Crossiella sp. SN42]
MLSKKIAAIGAGVLSLTLLATPTALGANISNGGRCVQQVRMTVQVDPASELLDYCDIGSLVRVHCTITRSTGTLYYRFTNDRVVRGYGQGAGVKLHKPNFPFRKCPS